MVGLIPPTLLESKVAHAEFDCRIAQAIEVMFRVYGSEICTDGAVAAVRIWIQFAPIFCFFVDVILLFERINAAQDELRGVYIYNIV